MEISNEAIGNEETTLKSTQCIPSTIKIIQQTKNWIKKYVRSPDPKSRIGVEIIIDGAPKTKNRLRRRSIFSNYVRKIHRRIIMSIPFAQLQQQYPPQHQEQQY
jgi:hypothetical protein